MRFLLFLLIFGIGVAMLGSGAVCQTAAPASDVPPPAASVASPAATSASDVSIYRGDDPSAEGLSLGGWGSGGAVKSQEQKLEGAWSIKISTQGMYSGAKLDFAQPVTLFANGNEVNRYLQFAFFFKETQMVNPAASTEYTYTDVEPYQKPKVSKMRFVFISDTGATIEVQEPTGALDPDDNWMRIAVPLVKLKTKDDVKEFRMKRLLIFTDIPCTMSSPLYLGSMSLMTDTTPIKVDAIDPRTVAIMDPQYFVAAATGGVSSLKYSWDFDDSNGIQVDSSDKIARTVYTKGGDFTVTLTVSDADGLKAPVTVSTKITVTD